MQTDGFTSYNGTVGHYQTFDNGSIQYLTNGSYAGQAFAIVNPLYTKWASLGFNSSNPLGYPIGDLSAQSTSYYGTSLKYQRFEGGALEYHLSGGYSGEVFEIHGGIYNKWGTMGYASSILGLPTSDEEEALQSGTEGFNTTGRVSDFEGGHIHWHRNGAYAEQAFETHGAIDNLYATQYGSGSWLGFPISDEYVDITGYARNDFEGGYITTTDGVNYQAFPYDDVREIDEGESPPSNFVLFQNYPNPFNPTTNIEFLLPKSAQVKIEIFNILGQKVRTLVDQHLRAGHKVVDWNGKDDSGEEVSSGIYFYQIKTSQFSQAKKMVLLR